MLNDKIAALRKILNDKTKTNGLNDVDTLNLSKELDNLIAEYYIELLKNKKTKHDLR